MRYRSPDEDSARWLGLPLRDGDIVISSRSKSGTTWVQMICALLVLQMPRLPEPLGKLSPWVDWLGTPVETLSEQLSAQHHRRFLKTHTPLDGVPLAPGVHYIVVARHPLDMAVSLYYQGDNIDRSVVADLTDQPPPDQTALHERPSLHDWILGWMTSTAPPREKLDTLPGVMWHLVDAWSRRDESNVTLVHYQDLTDDLDGEMRKLAAVLDMTVPAAVWPTLVKAATFTAMKDRAMDLAPDPGGHRVLKDPTAFFRRGNSGEGIQVLTPAEIADYHERVATLAPDDLLAWLHRF